VRKPTDGLSREDILITCNGDLVMSTPTRVKPAQDGINHLRNRFAEAGFHVVSKKDKQEIRQQRPHRGRRLLLAVHLPKGATPQTALLVGAGVLDASLPFMADLSSAPRPRDNPRNGMARAGSYSQRYRTLYSYH